MAPPKLHVNEIHTLGWLWKAPLLNAIKKRYKYIMPQTGEENAD